MLEYNIPNYKKLKISKLVFDFNGTLACNGNIIPGVKKRLQSLSEKSKIIILTADTFGTVSDKFTDIDVEIEIIDSGDGRVSKRDFIEAKDPRSIIAVGNGSNDELMLKTAALGILVIGAEGAATVSLLSSDLVVKDINDALDLLIYPKRLIASLRR